MPASINLARLLTPFAHLQDTFAQVVDFVPTDETQKQQARERYKALSPGRPYPRNEGSARPCRTGSGAARPQRIDP
ncbi:DNA polymerase III subunit chi [Escherichia coli]